MNYELMNDQGDLQYVKLLEDSGELKAGTAIHNKSRFWSAYQKWLAEGNTPRPIRPSMYHTWDGSTWVKDTTKKEADEAAQLLAETDKQQARSVDDIIDYIVNGTPIPQVVSDRQASRAAARSKLKG